VTAVFSPCRTWRYRLERQLNDGDIAPGTEDLVQPMTRGAVAFTGLNPSTADEVADDPTITRCRRFARRWGYSRLIMANAYAFRSTDPRGLWATPDPVGPENDAHLEVIARDVELVVCAWGAHARPDRVAAVLAALARGGRRPHALHTTKAGAPGHPLYLPATLTPAPWSPRC
jgi:hypothetical protein